MATTLARQLRTGRRRVQPRRILVVDEDMLVGSVVVQGLAALGHRATHCTSADEALRFCADGLADAVLMEARLLTSAGDRLADLLAARHPQLPLALLTAWSDHSDLAAGEPASIRMLLRKPIRLDQLDLAVRALVGRTLAPVECPN